MYPMKNNTYVEMKALHTNREREDSPEDGLVSVVREGEVANDGPSLSAEDDVVGLHVEMGDPSGGVEVLEAAYDIPQVAAQRGQRDRALLHLAVKVPSLQQRHDEDVRPGSGDALEEKGIGQLSKYTLREAISYLEERFK